MSFRKQEPPKPTPARRNLGPIRRSMPTARLTWATLAPVRSHSAEIAFTDDMRWARKALAVSLANSLDQTSVVIMFSLGTQWA